MVDFSLWDIVRNLLLAARWTVMLSLIAFLGVRETPRMRIGRVPGLQSGA